MVNPAGWFQDWFNSPYYHLLYAQRDDQEAARFIDRLLDYLKPAPLSRMLDVACGRGRHARILAERGFDVTGIDLAPESIAYAQQWAGEHLHFFVQDMRQAYHIRYFDYAFNFFTSFGYFKNNREHQNAIRSVSQSLRPGGWFVLDYLNIPFAIQHLVAQSVIQSGDVTFHLQRWQDGHHIYKKILIEGPRADLPREFTERIACFVQEDFESMFSRSGLRIVSLFGNYRLEPFSLDRSPRLILVARKSGQPGESPL